MAVADRRRVARAAFGDGVVTEPSPASRRGSIAAVPVDRAEAIALAEARFSEGFCPFCPGRLAPLSEYDVKRTRDWWSPPTAACLSCERAIGRYPTGGVHGSTLHHLDEPSEPLVEIAP